MIIPRTTELTAEQCCQTQRASLKKQCATMNQLDVEVLTDSALKDWYRHTPVPESTLCWECFRE
eukprot:5126126-Amphidinium_carterae.1